MFMKVSYLIIRNIILIINSKILQNNSDFHNYQAGRYYNKINYRKYKYSKFLTAFICYIGSW